MVNTGSKTWVCLILARAVGGGAMCTGVYMMNATTDLCLCNYNNHALSITLLFGQRHSLVA